MNRFLIDHHPDAIAKQLCDVHICKMPTEEAQMLSSAVWYHRPDIHAQLELYKPSHIHKKEVDGKEVLTGHPCTLWALETRANYVFAWKLYDAMLREYTFRYGKIHGASNPSTTNTNVHADELLEAAQFIPEGQLTKHPQCFGDHNKHLMTDEVWPIMAYRTFYVVDKSKIAKYNNGRPRPSWMKGEVA